MMTLEIMILGGAVAMMGLGAVLPVLYHVAVRGV